MRRRLALMMMPALAHGGVAYELAVRPVDENLALAGPAAVPPKVSHFFVEDGRVRIGGPDAKMNYLFKDHLLYVIDNTAHTVTVLKHATLSAVAAHYADAVKQLEAAAAAAPPDERAGAAQKAADMQAASDRLLAPVARDYRVTVRFESVDGHACRVWEESEGGAKHLELCVAPASSVPGGPDILNGLKTMSQYRQGSEVALGVNFGLTDWWPDFASMGGLPLLIREYKYDSVISETMLTGIRTAVPQAAWLTVPQGYAVGDGPDTAQWYMR